MSSPTTSLVKIPKEIIEISANNMFASVKKRRAQAREDEIKKYMDSFGWLQKILRKPTSREEAEKFIDGPHPTLSDYGRWEYIGWSTEEIAKSLLNAAQMSVDGFVWLNLEDALLVKKYSA